MIGKKLIIKSYWMSGWILITDCNTNNTVTGNWMRIKRPNLCLNKKYPENSKNPDGIGMW